MLKPVLFLFELARILLMLMIIAWIIGLLISGLLTTISISLEEQRLWKIQYGLAVIVTSIWYRRRGQYTGWYPIKRKHK